MDMAKKDVLDQAVASSVDMKDMLLAGAVKPVLERGIAMTPVGNNNLASGLTKLGLAMGTKRYAPTPVTIALAVDGAEDVMNNVLNMAFGFFGGASNGGSSSAGLTMEVI